MASDLTKRIGKLERAVEPPDDSEAVICVEDTPENRSKYGLDVSAPGVPQGFYVKRTLVLFLSAADMRL